MANSLASDLREGFRRTASALTGEELALISLARDRAHVALVERNRLLAEVVCLYRTGPRQVWGPVILDLLAPALVDLLRSLRPEPPALTGEEIRQQLVFEALRAAATIPILEGGRQTRFRIVSRVRTRMLRWLAREGRLQRSQISLASLDEDFGDRDREAHFGESIAGSRENL